MPRLTLTLPAELGCTSGRQEGAGTSRDQPPSQVGPGQRASDEVTARTIRWFAAWAGT